MVPIHFRIWAPKHVNRKGGILGWYRQLGLHGFGLNTCFDMIEILSIISLAPYHNAFGCSLYYFPFSNNFKPQKAWEWSEEFSIAFEGIAAAEAMVENKGPCQCWKWKDQETQTRIHPIKKNLFPVGFCDKIWRAFQHVTRRNWHGKLIRWPQWLHSCPYGSNPTWASECPVSPDILLCKRDLPLDEMFDSAITWLYRWI